MTGKLSTRDASSIQEKRIAKKFNGQVNSNSGAGLFNKSDVVVRTASLSIECKTSMTEKQSFSVKKEWFEKHKNEAFANRLDNHIIAFNFFYDDKNDYYIIDDKLMQKLIAYLNDENNY